MNHVAFPSVDIGGIRVTRIVESEGPLLKPAEIFPDSTPEIIRANLDWLAPRYYDPQEDKLVISIQSFILETEGKIIVVDTCVGDCKSRARGEFHQKSWHWLNRLESFGIAPEDVDIVLSTHLHVDHVGWSTRLVDGEWKPTFPNARYLFTHEEWAYWKDNEGHPALARSGDYIGDSIWPLFHAGQAELVGMDHQITERVKLVPQPGHTPGHVGLALTGLQQNAYLAGDLFHHLLQCCYPAWNTRFDIQPELSRPTRLAMMQKLAEEGTLIFPAHFPLSNAGRLQKIEPGQYPEHPDHVYRFQFEAFDE